MANRSNDKQKIWWKVIFCLSSCFLLIIGVFLLIATKRIIQIFGYVSFDQILFHISMPKGAVNPQVIKSFCAIGRLVKLAIIFVIIFCVFTLGLIHKTIFNFTSNVFCYVGNRLHIFSFAISFTIFIFSFLFFANTFNVFGSLIAIHQKSTLIDENYSIPPSLNEFHQYDSDGKEIDISKKPNLILIVSESLEQTFADKNIFDKNLIPEITDLQIKGDYTLDLCQVYGCHYTIASMYSILYGLPLLYLANRNGEPVRKNIFQAECISIFDVLAHNGYQITHLQGTLLRFAGQGALFEHLPNVKVIGLEDFSLQDYPLRQPWGIWDSDLFTKAKEEILTNQQPGKPFAFSIQTVDTHSDSHLQPGQEKIFGDIRDVIALQSKLVADFIIWIQEQPFGFNTVIVIVGDHNMMTNKIGNVELSNFKRRVFNSIFNSQNNHKIANRKAAMFDFAPTILDALGFEWPTYSLGIGRSLYRDRKTLLEEHGISTWNKESKMRSLKYRSLIK